MPQKRKITPEDLWEMKFVGDPQVSPDGEQVAFVVTETDLDNDGYHSAIWIADVDDKESVRQFTNPPECDFAVRERSPRWAPDGLRLAFISNRAGKNQIWCINRGGGEAFLLGDFESNISSISWSPDGSKLTFVAEPPAEEENDDTDEPVDVYTTNRLRYKFNGRGFMDDDRRNHIWVMDVASGEVEQLTDAENDDASPAWSPDGESIIFASDRRCELEMYYVPDLYSINLSTGEESRMSADTGPVAGPTYSPDGDQIAFFGHNEGDSMTANAQLFLMNSDGEHWRSLTADFDRSVGNSVGVDARFDGGQTTPIFCEDGNYILFNLTDGGNCGLYRTDLEGNTSKLDGLPPVVTSYSANTSGEPTIAAVGADVDTPGDLWILPSDGEPVQLTDFNRELFDEVQISWPKRIVFEGAERWDIEGWLLKPVGFESGEKYPLVLEIHGGPAGTSGNAFFQEYQLLAAAGYGVLYTNPRGSKGYGEKHAKGVIGDWGGNDYRDLMAAVDYATQKDWVDENRLGVTGGSYGGYMTNWIISQTNRFNAAVTFRSISNLYTKYGCSDIGFYSNRRGMAGAELWEDEDFIMSRSPIRYAPQVQTPILIVHAEEDYRCPMEQAEQWYVALKRLGVDCEFVRYDGEHHDLSRSGKPHNRVDRLKRLLGWFDEKL